MSNQAAVTQAIEQWLEVKAEPVSPRERTSENEHWHSLLEEILASGDEEAISAVRQNLLVFHRLIRSQGGAATGRKVPVKHAPAD